jgi:hypothetical protein
LPESQAKESISLTIRQSGETPVRFRYYAAVYISTKKARKPLILLDLRAFSVPEPPGTRTPDNLIKSQVLYHLS